MSRFPISELGKLAPAPKPPVVPVPGPFQKTTMLSRHISYLKDFFRSYKDFTTAQLDTIELMLQKLYRRFDMDDYTDFSQGDELTTRFAKGEIKSIVTKK